MTDLVHYFLLLQSLLILKFLTLVRLLFLVTIIIFGELISATSEERITMNIIFAGATPIN